MIHPIMRRPRLTVASLLVPVIIVIGVSLWSAAPWKGNPPHPSDASAGRAGVPGVMGVPGPPGRPAPTFFEPVWKVDKNQIEPGEQVTVTLALKNVWSHRIELTDFPGTARLNRIGTDNEEPIPVELTGGEEASIVLDPGEELIAFTEVSPEMSADLEPGGYYLRMDVRLVTEREDSERSESEMGFGSGITFVVTPPEGALDTTIIVRQAREDDGVQLTLDSMHFSPVLSTAVVLAPSSVGPSEATGSAPAPVPTRTSQSLGTPTPMAAPFPAAVDAPDLTASFSPDGGPWQELRSSRPQATPDGIRYRWTFDPVSANVETLKVAVTSVAQAGSEDALLWEWTVPLQEQD